MIKTVDVLLESKEKLRLSKYTLIGSEHTDGGGDLSYKLAISIKGRTAERFCDRKITTTDLIYMILHVTYHMNSTLGIGLRSTGTSQDNKGGFNPDISAKLTLSQPVRPAADQLNVWEQRLCIPYSIELRTCSVRNMFRIFSDLPTGRLSYIFTAVPVFSQTECAYETGVDAVKLWRYRNSCGNMKYQ